MSPILSQWPLSLAMYFPIWDYVIIISLGQVCFSKIPKMSKVRIRSWRWLSAGRLLMRCLKRGGRSCRNLWWTPMCVCNLPSTVKDFQGIYNAISKPPFTNRNTETWQRWSVGCWTVLCHIRQRSLNNDVCQLWCEYIFILSHAPWYLYRGTHLSVGFKYNLKPGTSCHRTDNMIRHVNVRNVGHLRTISNWCMIALCRQSDRALDDLKGMIILLFKFRFVCYRNALSIQIVKNQAIATYRPSSLNVSKTHNVHMDIKVGVEKDGKQGI